MEIRTYYDGKDNIKIDNLSGMKIRYKNGNTYYVIKRFRSLLIAPLKKQYRSGEEG